MYSVENGIPFATAMFRQSFSTLWVKSQIPVFSGAPFRIATVGVPVDEIVGPDTGGVVGEDVGGSSTACRPNNQRLVQHCSGCR